MKVWFCSLSVLRKCSKAFAGFFRVGVGLMMCPSSLGSLVDTTRVPTRLFMFDLPFFFRSVFLVINYCFFFFYSFRSPLYCSDVCSMEWAGVSLRMRRRRKMTQKHTFSVSWRKCCSVVSDKGLLTFRWLLLLFIVITLRESSQSQECWQTILLSAKTNRFRECARRVTDHISKASRVDLLLLRVFLFKPHFVFYTPYYICEIHLFFFYFI
jgi:hypothetical protein